MISIDEVTIRDASSEFCLSVPSYRVEAGATVTVVGSGGSGKTTLLNWAVGILVPNSGQILTVTGNHGLFDRFDETFDVGQFHTAGKGQP